MSAPVEVAAAIMRPTAGERLRTGFPMASLTTFRIGGPAALYLEPDSDADLAAAGRAIADTQIPYVVIGKGSNVLVGDAGFPGLVLRLGRGFRWIAREGQILAAGASTPLPALAGEAQRHALDGLAFGVAIPASLGGAVKMNAGAHGHEMSEVVGEVEVFSLLRQERSTLHRELLGFAYRRSDLAEDSVIVATTLHLGTGDRVAIRAAMDEAREWRRATQPLAEPNCGSVFTNPAGDHAARLIEAAGLKGARIGGAAVSDKHANFIVTSPGATSTDVLRLIDTIREKVLGSAGVELETEVRFIGVEDAS